MFRIFSAFLICGLYLFGNPVFAGTLVITETKLTTIDAAEGDFFGSSVAFSGDTAVVAAVDDNDKGSSSGSAYVFVREVDGTWTEQQELTASDGAQLDFFGDSVAIDGDTIVVGATGNDDAGEDSGSVYVFVRTGTAWTEQQKITAGDAAARDFFGRSVAVSGNTLVAGATGDDDVGSGSGSAYVFVRSGSTWSLQQKLTASDAAGGDQFGHSSALDGDTVVVGAPFDSDVVSNLGSAYVFVRSGTTWTQQQKLIAGDAAADDNFGSSVTLSGNTVAVGAPGDNSLRGAAYVFARSGTTWSEEQKLIAGDGAAGDGFGGSVAVSVDTVVVGANSDDDAGSESGAAYVFVRSGSSWIQQTKLTASDAATNDFFGGSVAVIGDTVLVGSIFDDDAGSNSGSFYVYVLEVVPDVFQVTLTGTAFCAPEGGGPGPSRKFNLKGKDKDTGSITLDTSNLPVIIAVLELDRLNEFNLTGMALLKNPKSGVFQLFGKGSNPGIDLAMSGTIKINKKTGEWTSLAGKFQWVTLENEEKCTMTGKFKAK